MEYIQGLDGQISVFLHSLGIGFLLGVFYDAVCAVRAVLPGGRKVIFVTDILYVIVCAFASFCFILVLNDGRTLLYILAAQLLGFAGTTRNSMDSVSDRDYVIEYLSALATVMMHLSRFSEEIIIWNSNEYRFVELDDAYSTGSSIMPQKKNPDIAELVRGKTGRVYGALMGFLTTMKGLPLAYNKDMQEDKEGVFDAIDTTEMCLTLFTGMVDTITFNKEVMEASAKNGFTNATDVADYLVNHGIPFRDAHGISGRLVLKCIAENKALDDLTLEEYRQECPVFEADIYEAISMKTCVERRLTLGAPGEAVMRQVIDENRAYLDKVCL